MGYHLHTLGFVGTRGKNRCQKVLNAIWFIASTLTMPDSGLIVSFSYDKPLKEVSRAVTQPRGSKIFMERTSSCACTSARGKVLKSTRCLAD